MRSLSVLLAAVALSDALYTPQQPLSRRRAIALAGSSALPALVGKPDATAAADETVKVYFGAGCFWHVQHEFAMEEMGTLKRSGSQITARTGYAGGSQLGDAGRVCYHNPRGFADYGRYGHSEVVQVEIPQSAFPRFATKYFDLFGTRGMRHDPMDRGGEYRSVMGLPGGQSNPQFDVVRQAALDSPGGMKLYAGRGDEPDTIGDKAVLVYDSDKFPFHAAELYHQFHNDFMGAPYGKAYNDLQTTLYAENKLGLTGCPDMDPTKGNVASGFPF